MKKYKTILIDPPWEYTHRPGLYYPPKYHVDGKAIPAKNYPMPYPTMTVVGVTKLPIQKLLEKDAHVYLWTTQRYMADALEIIKEWNLKLGSILVWCKKPRGIVGTYICSAEFLLFARKGSLKAKRKNMGSTFHWKRKGKHSTKPIESYELIEGISHAPYLELFARNKRIGWDVWGNEVESDITL